ncbi:MAG: hypothetical protein WD825_09065 [Gemmatimonadaceae bacterium]
MAAITCAVLIALGSPAGAQAPVSSDTASASARASVLRLIDAARRADWKTMQPYFPAGTPWESGIQSIVLEQDRRPETYSFWVRGVGIREDRLRVHMFSPDSALITTPFTVRGGRGTLDAVLVRRPDRWVLARTTESYGQQAAVLP